MSGVTTSATERPRNASAPRMASASERIPLSAAGLNAVDLEIDETDPAKFISIVRSLEPSFGGINLEDIKAPECFEIEKGRDAPCI